MIIEEQIRILEEVLKDNIKQDNINESDMLSLINGSNKINNSLNVIVSECSIDKEINKDIYEDTLSKISSNILKRMLTTYININNYKIVEEEVEEIEETEALETASSVIVDDNEKMFFRELKKLPILSDEETNELIKKYKETGDVNYRNQIISGHLRLVIYIAKRYIGKAEFLDLIQEGSLGFGKAIDKFDMDRGCKLSTYSTWWIRQAINRYIEDKADLIRKPVYISHNLKKINNAIKEYQSQNLGKDPSTEELSRITGLSIKEIDRNLSYNLVSTSLNKDVSEDGDGDTTELMEFVADEKSEKDIYDNVYLSDIQLLIREVIAEEFSGKGKKQSSQSDPKIKFVLENRFGLNDGISKTLEEVAALTGESNLFTKQITRERVRQYEARGLLRLRRNPKVKKLKIYND